MPYNNAITHVKELAYGTADRMDVLDSNQETIEAFTVVIECLSDNGNLDHENISALVKTLFVAAWRASDLDRTWGDVVP